MSVTPEEHQRLGAISDALARLVRRQTEIEQRLARLEATLNLKPPAPTAAEPAPRPIPPAIPAPRARRLETAFGLTWISRIGMITVVLAMAFFFEYAFENRWITETVRVLLGLACGAVSLFFGERLWRGGQRTLAQTLTAAGIAFLYLSFWAAFALYRLLIQPAAFGLMLLTTGAAGALAFRYQGVAVAVLGLAGGYATPLLLGNERDPWFVLSYALLLNLGAAVAARSRGWRWLEALALAGSVILYATQMQSPIPSGLRWIYTLFLSLYYAQFAVAALPPVCITAQILIGIALVQIWKPGAAIPSLLLVIAAAGLAVAKRRRWSAAVTGSFAGFWIAYAFWRSSNGPGVPVALPLTVLTGSFLLFLGWPLWRAGDRNPSASFQDLLVMALNAAFYFGSAYALLETAYRSYQGLFAMITAFLAAATARLLWGRDHRAALLAAGIAWTLLVLAAPIQLVGYRVTLAWGLESAAIVWIGARLQTRPALYAAAAVFLMVLLRLAFVDSHMYPDAYSYRPLVNARFLVFLVAALSAGAAAWWTRKQPAFAVCAYTAAHGVLLWGLGLEVMGWAKRTAAPENFRSVATTSISVLVASYAVLLVAAGVFQRHPLTRVMGVALIGLVVLKLYLYDVWLLGQFYRMAAFAILGLLLLLMSYFYSRFRGSMETWWRP